MAQSDYELANQKGGPFRAELNNILLSIATQNAGATEPAVTFAFQPWADTSTATPTLKIRNKDNSGWITIGDLTLDNLGLALATYVTGKVSKNVAGNSDVTLTAAEAKNGLISLSGAMTGNINLILPATVNRWIIQNGTSGAFSVTVKTPSGTGVAAAQGVATTVFSDGVNVVQANGLADKSVPTSALALGAATGDRLGPDVVVLGGQQTMTGQKVAANGTLTDAANIDWNGNTNGQVVKLTTAAARTFNAPTNILENAMYALRLTTGGFTPAWNAAFRWPSGGTPSGLASGTYVFTFIGGAGNTLIPTGPGYLTGD